MKTTVTLPALLHQIKVFLKRSYWLTPINLEEARISFLQNQVINPIFVYPEMPLEQLKVFQLELKSTPESEGNSLEAYVTNRSKHELELKIDLLLARGTERLGPISQKLYDCSFNSSYIDQAKVDTNIQETFGGKDNASVEKVVETFQSNLKKYGVSNWTVKPTIESDFYVRVIPHKQLVQVSRSINWDFCDLDNLIAHEIDGHVLRGINASKQKHPLLRKPFPFYIKTEEGLASYLADYHSSTGNLSRKHHALKYLAGHLGTRSTFIEIFSYFMDYGFTPDLAFQRTFRLKRGFDDTSMPGIYAREAVYYEGMLQVKDYLSSGGDLEKLYSCKCGLLDLEYVELTEHQLLPERLTI